MIKLCELLHERERERKSFGGWVLISWQSTSLYNNLCCHHRFVSALVDQTIRPPVLTSLFHLQGHSFQNHHLVNLNIIYLLAVTSNGYINFLLTCRYIRKIVDISLGSSFPSNVCIYLPSCHTIFHVELEKGEWGECCFISRFLTFSKGPLSRSGALELTGTLQWDTAISFFICCHFFRPFLGKGEGESCCWSHHFSMIDFTLPPPTLEFNSQK